MDNNTIFIQVSGFGPPPLPTGAPENYQKIALKTVMFSRFSLTFSFAYVGINFRYNILIGSN